MALLPPPTIVVRIFVMVKESRNRFVVVDSSRKKWVFRPSF